LFATTYRKAMLSQAVFFVLNDSSIDGFWDILGMKAASLFQLHESEVWQGLLRLVVEVFWALGDAMGRSGGVTGRSGGAT
jgi:hypothetical protein